MPKNNIDFSKAFIYKIVCNDVNIKSLYVGSSCNFVKRKCGHKTACNNEKSKSYNYNVYQFIRLNGGWANWSMLKICDYPCLNRAELAIKEREYMELLTSDLNSQTPLKPLKEVIVHDYNKQEKAEYDKEYRRVYKSNIQIKRSQSVVCECGRPYTILHKNRHLKTKLHTDIIKEVIKL